MMTIVCLLYRFYTNGLVNQPSDIPPENNCRTSLYFPTSLCSYIFFRNHFVAIL